jgi:polysaccharide pyruvyl transferase WcaK-like protein
MNLAPVPLRTPAIPRRAFLTGTAAAAAVAAARPLKAATNPARPKRILIANAWHCINIGDIAHTPGLLHLLETYVPEADVTLWPIPSLYRSPRQRELSPEVRTMLRANFPRLTILQAGFASVAGNEVRPDVAQAMREADLFINGSGGGMRPGAIDAWRAATRKPYGAYGVSFGEPSSEAATRVREAAFAFGRDSVSVANLNRRGFTGDRYSFGPDATFALHVRDEARAERYLHTHALENKKFICVIPRHRTSPYHQIYNYEPNEREREIDRLNAEFNGRDHAAPRELIVNWVRTTGLKVLACPEMTYGVPLAKEQLVDPLPADVRRHVVWKDSFWNADEAASVFERALAIVSLDCHSPIIALAAGTPAIHLRVPTDHPHKSRMFADIGLPEWIQELEGMTGARLTEMVMDIHREPAVAAQKVYRAMQFVRQRQAVTMGWVRAALMA